MCAGAILNARIPRVIFGARDPRLGAMGSVFDLFYENVGFRPQVRTGLLGQDCGALLAAFFEKVRKEKAE